MCMWESSGGWPRLLFESMERFLVPKTILLRYSGPATLNIKVLGPSGLWVTYCTGNPNIGTVTSTTAFSDPPLQVVQNKPPPKAQICACRERLLLYRTREDSAGRSEGRRS